MSSTTSPTSSATVSYHITSSQVAIITLNNPPVNALSARLVSPLIETYQKLKRNANVKAFVIKSANDKIFVSGADIKEFGKDSGKNIQRFVPFLDEMESGTKPVVMLIEGQALGGGCELAMSGHYRIAGPKAQMGLVELQLGLIPGAAGTQRMPRLVGAQKAAEFMLKSTVLRGKQLQDSGLVDEYATDKTRESLEAHAEKVALRLAQNPKLVRRASQLTDKIDLQRDVPQVKAMLSQLTQMGKTRNQIHYDRVIDAMLVGLEKGYESGLKTEASHFLETLSSVQARGLMNIFFATRTSSKVPGITDQGLKVPQLKTVACLGGGTMGSGIAAWLLMNGCRVWLKEINEKAGEVARQRVLSNFASRLKSGRMSQQQVDAMMNNFKIVTNYDNFDQLDLVIEAIFEDIPLKKRIFSELEKVTNKNCILASNTSTIDIDVIASQTKCPDRIIGLHFFAPSFIQLLVEIIPGKQTSKSVVNAMVQLVKNFRKTPVVVGNCPGFLVNRIFGLTQPVAQFLLERGVDAQRIDRAAEQFGMAIGPLKVADLSGIDIVYHVGKLLADAYPDRYPKARPGTAAELMVSAKRLGQKVGKGYYNYEGRKAVTSDETKAILEQARKNAETQNISLDVSDEDIVKMLYFPVVDEGLRCLDENIAVRPSDIDVCSVLGMGFPAYRGGIMHWAKTIGYSNVKSDLKKWYDQYKFPTFQPCNSNYYGSGASSSGPKSAPASSGGASKINVPGFKASAIFEQIQDFIKAQPEVAKKIGVVFGFVVKADSGSQQEWTVDLKKGEVTLGLSSPECTISMKDRDFVSLIQGDLDPMTAFFGGQIKVSGDVSLAMKLQKLQIAA
eukprot:CAMPEP_0117443550 /NCGR_PEP_ID=MMETSP0759-20121206/4751_1 /TAXON_ID=63605 /ORGANISM="Percolomonas cosmopolitus, Strain WS" /LENGTH=842 /DNA_ID=CAMNT_0005235525 /DNA_START=2344 /DNA_END=4869 /DNA_ORIENTATION=+